MKMSAIETTALPAGSTVKHFAIAECLGFDQQICAYRADSVDTGVSVTLFEFLPAGLAMRSGQGVQALPGKGEAFAKALAAFTTRLRAAALVGHPALPLIEDIWQDNGTVYAVGPWRPGRPLLSELTAHGGAVDAPTFEGWVRSLCDALGSLHHHDLVHGNLSVGMVRVLDTGELQLPPVGPGSFGDEPPAWAAPEQHPLNPKPAGVGPWTDIYQLSALLVQVMTGQPPPAVVRRWEGAAPYERLAELAGRYPEGLVMAVKRGLSMHPSSRPASTAQWLQEAGLPDRREHARYDPLTPAPKPEPVRDPEVLSATDAAFRSSSPAPLATNSGHMPLRQTVEERLERAEHHPRRTPAWVWASAAVAVMALVGIVLLS